MIGTGVRFGLLPGGERGDLAVACPACRSEGVFTSPYDFLRDEAAEEAAADPRLRGVKWSGGFAVERFPDTCATPAAERVSAEAESAAGAARDGCVFAAGQVKGVGDSRRSTSLFIDKT